MEARSSGGGAPVAGGAVRRGGTSASPRMEALGAVGGGGHRQMQGDPLHLTPAAHRGFRLRWERWSIPAPPGLAERRSGALVRFLCFEGGAWADVEGKSAVPLRRAFLDGRVVAEAVYGGREFLFDAGTAEEVAMGWIDDRGAGFFPVPESGRKRKRGEPELEDGASSGVDERKLRKIRHEESGRKRKRGEPELEYGASSGVNDRSDESSDTVEPGRRDSPRVGGGVAITAVHKVVQGPRSRAFQMQGQLLAAARGADGGNAKFAWYGAPLADVAAAVEHGFGRTNSRVLGNRAHGNDVHLSLPQSPYASAMLANADENGEAHIVLCRVLMGWPEAIPAGSSKLHPNSDNYDSAADNMQNPQWYVIWGKDMNMRILPEYVVSFKCPSLHQMQGSSGATSMLKKPSPVARDMFPTLLAEIQWFVPSSKLQILQGTYNRFKVDNDQYERVLSYILILVNSVQIY
ncbi:probable inactive poly [ADP-ribose] polymerase SRO1 [Triticum dicoccoides]|uniref:probable inactive poly [ADP-ribose] polymerase SRO1 n=1 Tax=Triticum dicoccoides TaxID=85692 RepID=UPI00188E702B|nr:probable inactive poly [ADP-ribose] polymerase SRO1 [Triticum dicoccoides]